LWKIGDRSAWRAVSVREDNRGTDPGFVLFFGKGERFSRGDKAASYFLWRRESGASGPRIGAKPFPVHVSCRFAPPDEDRAAGNAPGRRTTVKRACKPEKFFHGRQRTRPAGEIKHAASVRASMALPENECGQVYLARKI